MKKVYTNVEVIKRNGTIEDFDSSKITNAVLKAVKASHPDMDIDASAESIAESVSDCVCEKTKAKLKESNKRIITAFVEDMQDMVERALIKKGYADTAKEYILYRNKRCEIRNTNLKVAECIEEILGKDSSESDLKRDNANINGDTAMGTMLQIGANVSKAYYLENRINKTASDMHKEGYIHIHDMDFYDLTVTCCQIDCLKLFKGGFNTGHGYLRDPQSISTAASLAAIAIQSDQNDCHGGQSIPNFDYSLSPYVLKTFHKNFIEEFIDLFNYNFKDRIINGSSEEVYNSIMESLKSDIKTETENIAMHDNYNEADIAVTITNMYKSLMKLGIAQELDTLQKIAEFSYNKALSKTDKMTFQAMEGFIHNCNTLHSRAGAQVPFSSINLGTHTTYEGRMLIKNLILALEAGLGHGETAIFPIVIFKVQEGVTHNKEDISYDLFRLACRVTAKRLFLNFSFLDSPFNKEYYKPGHPETEVSYMGCRTRVLGNVYDTEKQQSHSRGNLSFTSINLPRLAIEANGDKEKFFKSLDEMIGIVKAQLLERFEIIAKRKVFNFPFLMGQGVWLDSEKLKPTDEVREVIKHGSLSVGFVGLAEAMVSLYGHHHGEGKVYEDLAIEIVEFMKKKIDDIANYTHLNFTLLATPAENLVGRFLRCDRKKFGIIEGVTDKEFYTNSFHIPVNYNITCFNKIKLEAPFHAYTNAGHITYVELDGDTTQNIDVIEKIVRCMKESGIGYGSINHPVDRDPVCGYTGVIYDECPSCGRHETEQERFERIRRITGYLVGDLSSWNDAKRAEEKMRVKHGTFKSYSNEDVKNFVDQSFHGGMKHE